MSMHRTPDSNPASGQYSGTPRIVSMQVFPVAGQDSMLLNLSGAHGPYFTRNVVILTDNAGRQGVGEVPGGEYPPDTRGRQAARHWPKHWHVPAGVESCAGAFAQRDAGGRGQQTFDQRINVHVVTALEARCWICSANSLSTGGALLGEGLQRDSSGGVGLSVLHRRSQARLIWVPQRSGCRGRVAAAA